MLLHIYDADAPEIVETAMARYDMDRYLLGITNGGTNFLSSLNRLREEGRTFNRILFETHGNSGRIFFGRRLMNSDWINQNMFNQGYEALCPSPTRIYFNGCNVAADPDGWKFMEAMARVFLRRAGGSVFGHTSLGIEVPIWTWMTGTVVHFNGDLRTLYVGVGGTVTERHIQSDL